MLQEERVGEGGRRVSLTDRPPVDTGHIQGDIASRQFTFQGWNLEDRSGLEREMREPSNSSN